MRRKALPSVIQRIACRAGERAGKWLTNGFILSVGEQPGVSVFLLGLATGLAKEALLVTGNASDEDASSPAREASLEKLDGWTSGSRDSEC